MKGWRGAKKGNLAGGYGRKTRARCENGPRSTQTVKNHVKGDHKVRVRQDEKVKEKKNN